MTSEELDIYLLALEIYYDMILKDFPEDLTKELHEFIIDLEKRWVTIDGRHVNIGGDDSSGGGSGSLSKDEEAAVNTYISSDSYKINEKLRSGTPLTAEEQKIVDNLDSALEKMPKYEGTVYRSLSSDMMDNPDEFWKAHAVDSIVSYPAFTSTATSVYDENMDIQMEIISKNGRDIQAYNANENEVLFARNPIFHVINVKDKKIYMEEV